jgi:hypothetical protein
MQTFNRRIKREDSKHLIPKSRWKDTIKMALTEMECEGVEWIHVPRDTVQW